MRRCVGVLVGLYDMRLLSTVFVFERVSDYT
jgi:hypothetical protein